MTEGLQTLPVDDSSARGGERVRGSWLIVAFRSDRPFDEPSRHSLDGIDKVSVERGAAFEVERDVARRSLTLRLPDPSVSSRHFAIARAGEHRMLRDAGSRNGTLVNGVVRKVFPIEDGDIIEAGRTVFVFRDVLGTSREALEPDTGPRLLSRFATISPLFVDRAAAFPRLALADVSVLVLAETGTGKELISEALHALSGRTGPFVAVNCGAIPATMVEAELFGHRRGAFSGALESRPGLVRAADGGTLLLDEVGDLPPPCQAALLRVLETKMVRPIGETKETPVDVRFVAATHRDLPALVAEGQFRADLLARLSGHVMKLPPLRERKEDVGLFIGRALMAMGSHTSVPEGQPPGITFTSAATRALFRYDWPLNVRALHQCVQAAAVLAGDHPIDVGHLPEEVTAEPSGTSVSSPSSPPSLPTLSDAERRHRDELTALLREHGGNISAVARATGKARMQIQRWMKRYGLGR